MAANKGTNQEGTGKEGGGEGEKRERVDEEENFVDNVDNDKRKRKENRGANENTATDNLKAVSSSLVPEQVS